MEPGTPHGFIHSHNRFALPVGRNEAWAQLRRVDLYQSWWPWLRKFEAEDLAVGVRWQCEIQPPLPYRIRFGVVFDHVVEASEIQATIDGEVNGSASLHLVDGAAGCDVLISTDLAPRKLSLKLVSTVAPPVARFGHEWILETGVRQFIERAIVAE